MARARAKAPRKRPASGRAKTPAAKPFASGFLYGVLVGAAATLALIYLPDELASAGLPIIDPASGDADSVPTVEFEFMYRLPKERVVTGVEPPPSAADAVSPEVSADEPPMEYLLQAAAFRGRDDADTMRARLILATNAGAQIESARDAGGSTWHRVLVGPFETKDEMQQALATLRAMDVSPLPLERPRS